MFYRRLLERITPLMGMRGVTFHTSMRDRGLIVGVKMVLLVSRIITSACALHFHFGMAGIPSLKNGCLVLQATKEIMVKTSKNCITISIQLQRTRI